MALLRHLGQAHILTTPLPHTKEAKVTARHTTRATSRSTTTPTSGPTTTPTSGPTTTPTAPTLHIIPSVILREKIGTTFLYCWGLFNFPNSWGQLIYNSSIIHPTTITFIIHHNYNYHSSQAQAQAQAQMPFYMNTR